YGLLAEQSKRARRVIGRPHGRPLRADGVYLPGGSWSDGPLPVDDQRAAGSLRFTMIGDSSAAGLGVDTPSQGSPASCSPRPSGGCAGRASRSPPAPAPISV